MFRRFIKCAIKNRRIFTTNNKNNFMFESIDNALTGGMFEKIAQ